MENRNNCFICDKELVYSEGYKKSLCVICKNEFESNVECYSGHYVCDECHSATANQIIKTICLNSESTNPLEIADRIMKHQSIKMHGPEHHFLVPAVLLTAYYNCINEKEQIKEKIDLAEKRAKNVLGGFCGFYGNCGAGVGSGIFISLITGSTPLSKESWGLSNLATATSLMKIGECGGPRCCKRDTYIALREMTEFVKTNFDVELGKPENVICSFSKMNKECKKEDCKFYNNEN